MSTRLACLRQQRDGIKSRPVGAEEVRGPCRWTCPLGLEPAAGATRDHQQSTFNFWPLWTPDSQPSTLNHRLNMTSGLSSSPDYQLSTIGLFRASDHQLLRHCCTAR